MNAKVIAVIYDASTLETVFNHIANGGALTELCKMWKVNYSEVRSAIRNKPEIEARYAQACKDREEWLRERILAEVKSLGMFNIKDAINPDGTIKPLLDLPDELAAAIKEIDSDGGIKFTDKLKALDMLGKQAGLFVDKHEISGTMTLEQMIIASNSSKDKGD